MKFLLNLGLLCVVIQSQGSSTAGVLENQGNMKSHWATDTCTQPAAEFFTMHDDVSGRSTHLPSIHRKLNAEQFHSRAQAPIQWNFVRLKFVLTAASSDIWPSIVNSVQSFLLSMVTLPQLEICTQKHTITNRHRNAMAVVIFVLTRPQFSQSSPFLWNWVCCIDGVDMVHCWVNDIFSAKFLTPHKLIVPFYNDFPLAVSSPNNIN